MAKKKIPFKKSFIPIAAVQIVAMRNDFPNFLAHWDKKVVAWTGDLQPTMLSKKYSVRIVYSLDMDRPNVTILSPKLVNRNNESIPHVYPGNK